MNTKTHRNDTRLVAGKAGRGQINALAAFALSC
jgi:hypothetical protein